MSAAKVRRLAVMALLLSIGLLSPVLGYTGRYDYAQGKKAFARKSMDFQSQRQVYFEPTMEGKHSSYADFMGYRAGRQLTYDVRSGYKSGMVSSGGFSCELEVTCLCQTRAGWVMQALFKKVTYDSMAGSRNEPKSRIQLAAMVEASRVVFLARYDGEFAGMTYSAETSSEVKRMQGAIIQELAVVNPRLVLSRGDDAVTRQEGDGSSIYDAVYSLPENIQEGKSFKFTREKKFLEGHEGVPRSVTAGSSPHYDRAPTVRVGRTSKDHVLISASRYVEEVRSADVIVIRHGVSMPVGGTVRAMGSSDGTVKLESRLVMKLKTVHQTDAVISCSDIPAGIQALGSTGGAMLKDAKIAWPQKKHHNLVVRDGQLDLEALIQLAEGSKLGVDDIQQFIGKLTELYAFLSNIQSTMLVISNFANDLVTVQSLANKVVEDIQAGKKISKDEASLLAQMLIDKIFIFDISGSSPMGAIIEKMGAILGKLAGIAGDVTETIDDVSDATIGAIDSATATVAVKTPANDVASNTTPASDGASETKSATGDTVASNVAAQDGKGSMLDLLEGDDEDGDGDVGGDGDPEEDATSAKDALKKVLTLVGDFLSSLPDQVKQSLADYFGPLADAVKKLFAGIKKIGNSLTRMKTLAPTLGEDPSARKDAIANWKKELVESSKEATDDNPIIVIDSSVHMIHEGVMETIANGKELQVVVKDKLKNWEPQLQNVINNLSMSLMDWKWKKKFGGPEFLEVVVSAGFQVTFDPNGAGTDSDNDAAGDGGGADAPGSSDDAESTDDKSSAKSSNDSGKKSSGSKPGKKAMTAEELLEESNSIRPVHKLLQDDLREWAEEVAPEVFNKDTGEFDLNALHGQERPSMYHPKKRMPSTSSSTALTLLEDEEEITINPTGKMNTFIAFDMTGFSRSGRVFSLEFEPSVSKRGFQNMEPSMTLLGMELPLAFSLGGMMRNIMIIFAKQAVKELCSGELMSMLTAKIGAIIRSPDQPLLGKFLASGGSAGEAEPSQLELTIQMVLDVVVAVKTPMDEIQIEGVDTAKARQGMQKMEALLRFLLSVVKKIINPQSEEEIVVPQFLLDAGKAAATKAKAEVDSRVDGAVSKTTDKLNSKIAKMENDQAAEAAAQKGAKGGRSKGSSGKEGTGVKGGSMDEVVKESSGVKDLLKEDVEKLHKILDATEKKHKEHLERVGHHDDTNDLVEDIKATRDLLESLNFISTEEDNVDETESEEDKWHVETFVQMEMGLKSSGFMSTMGDGKEVIESSINDARAVIGVIKAKIDEGAKDPDLELAVEAFKAVVPNAQDNADDVLQATDALLVGVEQAINGTFSGMMLIDRVFESFSNMDVLRHILLKEEALRQVGEIFSGYGNIAKELSTQLPEEAKDKLEKVTEICGELSAGLDKAQDIAQCTVGLGFRIMDLVKETLAGGGVKALTPDKMAALSAKILKEPCIPYVAKELPLEDGPPKNALIAFVGFLPKIADILSTSVQLTNGVRDLVNTLERLSEGRLKGDPTKIVSEKWTPVATQSKDLLKVVINELEEAGVPPGAAAMSALRFMLRCLDASNKIAKILAGNAAKGKKLMEMGETPEAAPEGNGNTTKDQDPKDGGADVDAADDPAAQAAVDPNAPSGDGPATDVSPTDDGQDLKRDADTVSLCKGGELPVEGSVENRPLFIDTEFPIFITYIGPIIVYGVPVTISLDVQAEIVMELETASCSVKDLDTQGQVITLDYKVFTPLLSIAVKARARVGIGVPALSMGVGMQLQIVELTLPVQVDMMLELMAACVTVSPILEALSGNIFVYAQIGAVDLSFPLFQWSGFRRRLPGFCWAGDAEKFDTCSETPAINFVPPSSFNSATRPSFSGRCIPCRVKQSKTCDHMYCDASHLRVTSLSGLPNMVYMMNEWMQQNVVAQCGNKLSELPRYIDVQMMQVCDEIVEEPGVGMPLEYSAKIGIRWIDSEKESTWLAMKMKESKKGLEDDGGVSNEGTYKFETQHILGHHFNSWEFPKAEQAPIDVSSLQKKFDINLKLYKATQDPFAGEERYPRADRSPTLIPLSQMIVDPKSSQIKVGQSPCVDPDGDINKRWWGTTSRANDVVAPVADGADKTESTGGVQTGDKSVSAVDESPEPDTSSGKVMPPVTIEDGSSQKDPQPSESTSENGGSVESSDEHASATRKKSPEAKGSKASGNPAPTALLQLSKGSGVDADMLKMIVGVERNLEAAVQHIERMNEKGTPQEPQDAATDGNPSSNTDEASSDNKASADAGADASASDATAASATAGEDRNTGSPASPSCLPYRPGDLRATGQCYLCSLTTFRTADGMMTKILCPDFGSRTPEILGPGSPLTKEARKNLQTALTLGPAACVDNIDEAKIKKQLTSPDVMGKKISMYVCDEYFDDEGNYHGYIGVMKALPRYFKFTIKKGLSKSEQEAKSNEDYKKKGVFGKMTSSVGGVVGGAAGLVASPFAGNKKLENSGYAKCKIKELKDIGQSDDTRLRSLVNLLDSSHEERNLYRAIMKRCIKPSQIMTEDRDSYGGFNELASADMKSVVIDNADVGYASSGKCFWCEGVDKKHIHCGLADETKAERLMIYGFKEEEDGDKSPQKILSKILSAVVTSVAQKEHMPKLQQEKVDVKPGTVFGRWAVCDETVWSNQSGTPTVCGGILCNRWALTRICFRYLFPCDMLENRELAEASAADIMSSVTQARLDPGNEKDAAYMFLFDKAIAKAVYGGGPLANEDTADWEMKDCESKPPGVG